MRMTPEEIKRRFPNDEDLQYGFDGADRYGRVWYGKGVRLCVGPTPNTGVAKLYPYRGGNDEIINYFTLTCSGSPNERPLYLFVSPSGHEPLSYD